METKKSSLIVFAIVPLGLESLAWFELQLKFPEMVSASKMQKGGIDIQLNENFGFQIDSICRNLKIPTRFLLRISEFKCKDFPKLFQKVQNIKWRQYLCGGAYDLKVSASQSRLNHEGRIEQTVRDGLARHFEKQPPKKVLSPFKHTIYVRVFDDLVTLSMDLSGNANFKREYKELSALAPLRENYAAAIYVAALQTIANQSEILKSVNFADANGQIQIAVYDPVCGSGTLAFESALFFAPQLREFAFSKLPVLADENSEVFPDVKKTQNLSAQVQVSIAFGCDKAVDSIKSAVATVQNIQGDLKKWTGATLQTTKFEFENCGWLAGAEKFEQMVSTQLVGKSDLMNLDGQSQQNPHDGTATKHIYRVLLSNLPYGERIQIAAGPKKFIAEFLSTAMPSNLDAGVILVHRDHGQYVPEKVGKMTAASRIHFTNGGIPVTLVIFAR